MNTLYTIGHSQHKLEQFLIMLQKYKINYVVDVRSVPYSKFAADYNKENIKAFLGRYDIQYIYQGGNFGARPVDLDLYNEEGYLDFQRVAATTRFQKAMEQILKGIQADNKIALMCTEKNPIDCHRCILVAKAFVECQVNVDHILPNTLLTNHCDIEKALLEMYFPERKQGQFFTNVTDEIDDEQYLANAYQLRNKEIGYYINMKEQNVM